MDERVHLFGIRHHGPGSAASLVAALDDLQPTAVLIEGPPEADPLIPYAAAPGMRPPLALLAYAVDDPATSVFFPLAVFSPEWQAMRWALRHERPVRFIDWPAATSLAARAPPQAVQPATDPVAPDPTSPATQPSTEDRESEIVLGDADPLDRLATVSGHPDGEALWNALVESRGAAREVFAAIADAMTMLRAETGASVAGSVATLRETRREAHMRNEIRKALKEHSGPIAVIVGAWHVPALAKKATAAEDRAILKDLPRVKVAITWVPWTETRLAAASGYGAGVISPGWYAHLWSLYEHDRTPVAPDRFAATWQAKVATHLRAAGHAAAPASVIEAARLSLALAGIRGLATPGLDEMRDATLAALCHGDATPLRVIEASLVIGQDVGAIDESVPQMPLAADLAREQRRLRLKPAAVEEDITLDLRSEAGLAKSTLLHRLELIDVPWGRLVDAEAGRGTFREIWRLAWIPELSVRLAEALIHGITVAQAAAGAATTKADHGSDIAALADLVRRCLLADLPEAAERCIARLQAAAVGAADVASLMRAVPSLVATLRYGTARRMPVDALEALACALAAEVNAGVTLASRNLDDDVAENMRQAMTGYDSALTLLGDEHLAAEWLGQLRHLLDDPAVAPPIAGLALRLLYDRRSIDEAPLAAAFARALSPAVATKAAGQWLEGFLGAAAEVILQDRTLLGLIDHWLSEQPEEHFIEVLPVLRRSFANFGLAERRRLLDVVSREGSDAPAMTVDTTDHAAFARALPLLLQILGISRHD